MEEPQVKQPTLSANDVATVWPSREARKEATIETPPDTAAPKEEPEEEPVVDRDDNEPSQEWKEDERDEQIKILTTQLTAMAAQLKVLQDGQQKPTLQPQQRQYLDASKIDLTEALENPAAFVTMLNSAIVSAMSDAAELAKQNTRMELPGVVRAQIEQDRVAHQREAQFYERHKDLFTDVPATVANQRKALATQIMNGLYAKNAAFYDGLGEKAWDMLAIDTGKALREALNAPSTMQPRVSRSTERRTDSTKMFPPAGQRPDHKAAPPVSTKADEIESTLTKGRHYHAPIPTR